MTRKLTRLTVICSAALAALVAPFGCSGGGSGVDTTTYCGKAAVAICANMFACCTGAQREYTLGEENVNDEAKCQHDLAVSCEIDQAETLDAIDRGTVTYDDAKATTCIDSIKHPVGECALVTEKAPHEDACQDSPFQGTVAGGGACYWSFECVPGASCVSGKCKVPPTEGQDCTGSCAEGLYCKAGKCATLVASGGECTSDYQCQDDLYCDTTCKALKTPGNACEDDYECDSYDCLPGSCSDGSSCTSDGSCDEVCAHSGESCSYYTPCATVCEASGAACTFDSNCNVASNEQCVQDTCEPGACTGRVCAAKPLKVVDYCKLAD